MFLLNIEEMERSEITLVKIIQLQATSSRFSLFHLFVFTMQQHKINAKSTGL